jgi:hypothetical protein
VALAAQPDAEGLAVGSRLGRIEIVGKLGAGGMADVWLGRVRSQGDFVRLVAVKTVHRAMCRDKRSREMFLREAEISASIRHANVVDVHDVGEVDGILYQVMTLVEGENLATLLSLAGKSLPVGVAVSVVGDALLGLHAAHEAVDDQGRPLGLVHRDVSPQNILVGLDGVARVSDFGIAKALAANEETTGSLRGKFGYFSPEQAAQAPLDRRSDIFSMGIVLWESLTGTRLFRRGALVDTLSSVLNGEIPDPRTLNPVVPAAIVDVVMRALERPIGRRYPTADAMASDLMRAARTADCLLPRPDVALAVERLAGATVRARRAALAAAPDAGSADLQAPLAATSVLRHPSETVRTLAARGHRGVTVAAVGGALLLAALGGFGLARGGVFRGSVRASSEPAAAAPADAPGPSVAAAETQPLDAAPTSASTASTASRSVALDPAADAPAPTTPKTGKIPSRPPQSAPKTRTTAARKAPFDENPFGSSRPP